MFSNFEKPAAHSAKRRKRPYSIELIKKMVCSSKGEAIQALHIVFEYGSFSFETQLCANLQQKFVSFLNLEGYSFIGYGNTKTLAKSSACKIALNYLIEELKFNITNECNDLPIVDTSIETDVSDTSLQDTVSALVLNKYKDLRNESKCCLPWYKMIAGIVMLFKNDYRNPKLIALSTGSKSIDKESIRLDGTVIVDNHAEILCRRAFIYYLYSQLTTAMNESNSDVIFEIIPGTKKYKLKEGISFYLYVNSAPCGDCRIFAASNRESVSDKHPNRISRGVLRVKLDGRNNTAPINNFDKYQSSNRLMIMSCSDKLLKMNVLGVQGSLLSHFMNPIYLSGIVIGDLFHISHITRALYGRIKDNQSFSEPFILNKISIYGVSEETKVATKSMKTNMNWIVGESVEIIHSNSGRTISNSMSRVCKYNLFLKFFHIFKKYEPLQYNGTKNYNYFKNKAHDYQNAKKIFLDILENKNLGKWICRIPSLDYFELSDADFNYNNLL